VDVQGAEAGGLTVSAAYFTEVHTSSGLRPDAGGFLLFGQEKVTKEKAAPVSRALRVPCAACLTSAAVELVLPNRKRYDKTQTVLADFPEAKRAARRDTGAPKRCSAAHL
jgi:hypothetical protein